jgi:hypothetical protein
MMRAAFVVCRGLPTVLLGALLVLGCSTAASAQVVGDDEQESEQVLSGDFTLGGAEAGPGVACAAPIFGAPIVLAPGDFETDVEGGVFEEVDPATVCP